MSKAIEVESLSKLYRLGLVGRRTIAEDLNKFWARIRGKEDPYLKVGESNVRSVKGSSDYVWALKDINFEVGHGERFGIIGKNGAGKSTLLKILSRVASPTKGKVRLNGRVASLLEVGTGFHAELTGRDNIFLNGAILGMTQSEIRKKFDSIVDFSGVERYIDTPVKRYSSGMYVRLAFAVAAHLEPEILIVDEVLAVGDAEFQKKCLGKMHDVSEKEGRTVLFVSHNLQAIRNLCQKAIILDHGEMHANGSAEECLRTYNDLVREIKINADTEINDFTHRRGKGNIRMSSVEVTGMDGTTRFVFKRGERIFFRLKYNIYKEMSGLTVTIAMLSGISRESIALVHHVLTDNTLMPGDTGELLVEIEGLDIKPGEYPLYFELRDSKYNDYSKDVIDDLTPPLVVINGDEDSTETYNPGKPSGYFKVPSKIVINELIPGGYLKKAL
jgi:lipopolysaccharide transport system ATP-binding protein